MSIEALKLALEALDGLSEPYGVLKAQDAIKKVLAQQCVCGEPDSAGTHRTDGPCFAPQPEQIPPSVYSNTHQPEQEQIQPDKVCIEDDGCPTEKAVLQRFWREHQKTQPEQERNALPKAMNVVIAAMQADPGYAWSWHCNIAMAYVDEGVNRDVANQGAARFMKLLANVEPAHDILPTQTPDTKLKEQEPVAWGLPNANGDILDVISPEEHGRLEGGYTVPLYTSHEAAHGIKDEQ